MSGRGYACYAEKLSKPMRTRFWRLLNGIISALMGPVLELCSRERGHLDIFGLCKTGTRPSLVLHTSKLAID